jgi:hypothetical protein
VTGREQRDWNVLDAHACGPGHFELSWRSPDEAVVVWVRDRGPRAYNDAYFRRMAPRWRALGIEGPDVK